MLIETAKGGVEETRCRILGAARELYASKGSRGTTTREIAERAGVNEATVFRHFGTKLELLRAMLDRYGSASEIPELLERVRLLPTIEEQLRALAFALIDAMRRKEDLIKVSMAEEFTSPEHDACAWQAPTAARQRLCEYFAEKLASGELRGDAQLLARVFMSLVFSFVMARRVWVGLDMPDELAVGQIVEIFFNGARLR